jgi:hypothetical protein
VKDSLHFVFSQNAFQERDIIQFAVHDTHLPGCPAAKEHRLGDMVAHEAYDAGPALYQRFHHPGTEKTAAAGYKNTSILPVRIFQIVFL